MMAEGDGGARLGLRERKKLMTRGAILDAAQSMFAERGFDHVTVAEIADAVNISPKTVFVYFSAKEDLVFDGEAEMRDRIVARIRGRAPGETPLDAMGGLLRELLASYDPPAVTGLDRLRRTVGDSAVLKARMRLMWEHFEEAVAAVLAEEVGEDPHAPRPRVAAAQLVLVFRLMASEAVAEYVLAQPGPEQAAALENWLDVTLRQVAGGIDDFTPC
ncbi:MAG TPA: helix-turn-helix domain-containing protein [Amycolatopsis sp.]|jgi:AcrR family transcriptional regulator|uniref:TetR/AcrR family transcriptional regulator n=1 Tax=Pseudonocardia sp. TaxID=60912 RepID=UPI0026260BB1|nr:TetR/AcrR family transcriptional regulator [Pseudonocardia sp.]MCU1628243.1 transcriptional regulator, TetR family [Pseudonocardia sp.]